MWPFAMRAVSRLRRRRAGGPQSGSSLIATIALTGILALLVIASLSYARSTTAQTAREGRGDIALEAADAGINRYISRLVEDPRYYDHWIDTAEDPRVDPSGVVHQPGTAWSAGVPWTYQAGPSLTWADLQESRFGTAAYSLRIQPPPPGSDLVTVQSTAVSGRNQPKPVIRSIQSQIQPTSIADFQMISNATIKYGTAATTTGKLYSARDINHQGVAKAPVYAAHWACSSNNFDCPSSTTSASIYQAGAYDATTTPSFRDKFPTPIDFSQFTRSRLDIKDAATAGGTAWNDPTADAWMIQFTADGRVRVWRVTNTPDVGRQIGTLRCPQVVNVPANGAMYFEQSVIVSDGSNKQDTCTPTPGVGPRPSVVNGRVTVATKGNVYIGGNITYAAPGDDVLGLIAANELIIAKYTPDNLTWRAASLAQAGQWRTYEGNPDGHDSMLYIGSQTTANGGYASMFDTREYQYDMTLQHLRPPLYPVLEGSWTTFYWRQVQPPA
jgi:hypothetical protein